MQLGVAEYGELIPGPEGAACRPVAVAETAVDTAKTAYASKLDGYALISCPVVGGNARILSDSDSD